MNRTTEPGTLTNLSGRLLLWKRTGFTQQRVKDIERIHALSSMHSIVSQAAATTNPPSRSSSPADALAPVASVPFSSPRRPGGSRPSSRIRPGHSLRSLHSQHSSRSVGSVGRRNDFASAKSFVISAQSGETSEARAVARTSRVLEELIDTCFAQGKKRAGT